MPETLQQIAEEILASDLKDMYPNITNVVPGEGSNTAEIMIIGEAPGKQEDLEGRPFIGRSGKLLTKMLEEAGLDREEIFITNSVKIRPPENRDPTSKEKDLWFPFLKRQIIALKPKIIATLGRHSMNEFLPDATISVVHGQPQKVGGLWHEHQIVLPLYHPAVGLYNPSQKEVMIADFKKIPEILKQIKKDKVYGDL
jgi:DNA polymerase